MYWRKTASKKCKPLKTNTTSSQTVELGLGAIAWLDHVISGRPPGASVERAALFADPLLHLLFLGGATIFVAWQFGAHPAAWLSIGMAALFPFAAGFLPGEPGDPGMVRACACLSILPLLAGVRAAHSAAADARSRAQRWFFVAGIAGGLGMWIGVASQVPVLAGIALGGLLAAWAARDKASGNPASATQTLPWLTWALGGAAASFAGYLIEYFPAHMGSWQLRVIHPLYALAWLGGGAVLARAVAWIEREKASWSVREIVVLVLAVAALAAVPIAMWQTRSLGFLEVDLSAFRLTRLPGNARETSL
jgi:hypothetical protein